MIFLEVRSLPIENKFQAPGAEPNGRHPFFVNQRASTLALNNPSLPPLNPHNFDRIRSLCVYLARPCAKSATACEPTELPLLPETLLPTVVVGCWC